MSWSIHKIKSFCDKYMTYKNYEGCYGGDMQSDHKEDDGKPSSGNLPQVEGRRSYKEASFVTAAEDVAEFDMAIYQLNLTQQRLFIEHFIFNLELRDLAWLMRLSSRVVEEQTRLAWHRVTDYLLKL